MFTQLFNIEKFNHYCKGIVLGDFLNIDNEAWLEELFFTFTPPTVGGFKITHAQAKITLPIGKIAALDNNKLIIIMENKNYNLLNVYSFAVQEKYNVSHKYDLHI